MRTKKWTIIFLLFTGIILFATQSAFGGCEIAALDTLISDGNAPGTKLEGPLTVFYRKINEDPEGPAFMAEMYWFFRLRKGSQFYSFAGGPEEVIIPTHLLTEVPDIIETFFIDHVVSEVVSGCPPDCPEIVLKSYDMDVDEEAPGFDSGLLYFIANITVGIHD